MMWWEVVLCIIINAIWILPISIELILSLVDEYKLHRDVVKANKRYNEIHGRKKRKLCIKCPYCKWKYYHPFSSRGNYYWAAVLKTPIYCRKFNIKLKHDFNLVCVSKWNSEAMYENEPCDCANSLSPINNSYKECKYYRTPTGLKYHLDPICGGKNSFVTTDVSGLFPCSKCVKQNMEN